MTLYDELCDTITDYHDDFPELTWNELLSTIEKLRHNLTEKYIEIHPQVFFPVNVQKR